MQSDSQKNKARKPNLFTTQCGFMQLGGRTEGTLGGAADPLHSFPRQRRKCEFGHHYRRHVLQTLCSVGRRGGGGGEGGYTAGPASREYYDPLIRYDLCGPVRRAIRPAVAERRQDFLPVGFQTDRKWAASRPSVRRPVAVSVAAAPEEDELEVRDWAPAPTAVRSATARGAAPTMLYRSTAPFLRS